MSFAIGGNTPPEDAKPTVEAPPIVRHPKAIGVSAQNTPLFAGEPTAEVGRPFITQTGLDWYIARLGSGVLENEVTVVLYDPITGTWKTYIGSMGFPTYGINMFRATTDYRYSDFRVKFTGLTEQ